MRPDMSAVILASLTKTPSQLLEILTELNASPHIPPQHRYDLHPIGAKLPRTDADDPTAMSASEIKSAKAALREARLELKAGETSPTAYRELERSMLSNKSFQPSKSYIDLYQTTPHSIPAPIDYRPSDELGDRPPPLGYPTPLNEEHSYQAFSIHKTSPRYQSNKSLSKTVTSADPSQPYARIGTDPRTAERDRDMAIRNPVSVYNWLRKNQPQVFLQDNEVNSEKSTRGAGPRSSKRDRASKGEIVVKKEKTDEDDLPYDEDGIAMETFPTKGRGKRKRDEDGGYRPKGGSNRPAKRKKEDNGTRRGRKSTGS